FPTRRSSDLGRPHGGRGPLQGRRVSMAMPDPGKGSTFTIAGRKISWDALLVAGGGIVAVILLYRAGQPVSSGSATPVDTSGGGGTLASLGTLPSAIPPSDPTQPPGLAARIAAAPATSFFTS